MAAYQKGDPGEALRLQEKALAWSNLRLPIVHPFRAKVLTRIGELLASISRLMEARTFTQEAIVSYRSLTKDNPAFLEDLARGLIQSSLLDLSVGRNRDASASLEEFVRSIFELAEPKEDTAMILLKEAASRHVIYLQSQLPSLSEERSQDLTNAYGVFWQIPYSFVQYGEPGASLALFTRLNRQGLLQDIQRNKVLLSRNGPHRPLYERLVAVNNLLANLNLNQQERQDLVTHRDQLENDLNKQLVLQRQHLWSSISMIMSQLGNPNSAPQLQQELLKQKDQIELELYRYLPEVKPRVGNPAQVAARLPRDGVLVEFQQYQSVAIATGKYGSRRYLALVLTPKGAIHAVPLGEASDLELLIQTSLQKAATLSNRADSDEAAQQALAEVRRRLFDPLLPYVGGAKRWIVSPDGEINRVPLAALPARDDDDPQGATLGEERRLQIITTGRDLLPDRATRRPAPQAALVMAAPDYDATLPAPIAVARASTSLTGALPRKAGSSEQRRSADDLSKSWTALSNTEAEGNIVASLLGTTVIRGREATTSRLQRARSPRIVHIATHGYFLPDQPAQTKTGDPFQGFTSLELPFLRQEDPQLRSGIVLAGANHPEANPEDDGRLTAREATGLELEGTELVTLSACSTGLGRESIGEGVYGLQRALRLAGARSTLLSLWEVNDAATKDLMQRYYELLINQGLGRGEALRQAQREIRKARPHPRYWAAWQLTGDDGPLPKR
ncbi:MAG: CHAT domain-containing protein [Cyanobacteriota bacterium]